MHLTLAFLGSRSAADAEAVAALLPAVAQAHPVGSLSTRRRAVAAAAAAGRADGRPGGERRAARPAVGARRGAARGDRLRARAAGVPRRTSRSAASRARRGCARGPLDAPPALTFCAAGADALPLAHGPRRLALRAARPRPRVVLRTPRPARVTRAGVACVAAQRFARSACSSACTSAVRPVAVVTTIRTLVVFVFQSFTVTVTFDFVPSFLRLTNCRLAAVDVDDELDEAHALGAPERDPHGLALGADRLRATGDRAAGARAAARGHAGGPGEHGPRGGRAAPRSSRDRSSGRPA